MLSLEMGSRDVRLDASKYLRHSMKGRRITCKRVEKVFPDLFSDQVKSVIQERACYTYGTTYVDIKTHSDAEFRSAQCNGIGTRRNYSQPSMLENSRNNSPHTPNRQV